MKIVRIRSKTGWGISNYLLEANYHTHTMHTHRHTTHTCTCTTHACAHTCIHTHTCIHAHRGGNTQTISPGKCFLTEFVVTVEVPLLNRGRLTLLLSIVSDDMTSTNHALVYSSNHWQLSLKALQCLLSISELSWSVLASPYPRGTHWSTQNCSHAASSMIYDPRHWHLSGACDRQSQAPP